jgi:hypothetical protein
MKNFDSRTYSINDFVEWETNEQLVLSPRFQRGQVWSDKARSFLMDTIVRGKPIPKVFIRQSINPQTKKSVREVVDGQQRLRAILSYIKDGFKITKRHNEQYGGLYYSQLEQVDGDIQAAILNYEIAVDLLVNMPDAEVLDIFGRLNSYAVVLNAQERINANHFGPFKILVDRLANKYYEFWISSGLLTEKEIVRMGSANLVADLVIAMIEGVKNKKQIPFFYKRYENQFEVDSAVLEEKFDRTMGDIGTIFEGAVNDTQFHRHPLFYSLFTAVYHLRWGLPSLELSLLNPEQWNYARLREQLNVVDEIWQEHDKSVLPNDAKEFWTDSQRATTDPGPRTRRTKFLVSQMLA